MDEDMGEFMLKGDLRRYSNKRKATILQKFFKTGTGEYAWGDIFIGVTVPRLREIAKKYQNMNLREIISLLKSAIHEERLTALMILLLQYQAGSQADQSKIYEAYLDNMKYVNNWDLVDLTAPGIVGAYLFKRPKTDLYRLSRSNSLWDRRVSIVATFYFIRNNKFSQTLRIAKALIKDEEDLIHKAVGWMLREVGKRDLLAEEGFLKKYYKKIPRTMLRYAIEKFPEAKRQRYLKGAV